MSEPSQIDARAFGALEAEVRHLREKIEVQAGLLRDAMRDLRTLNDILTQARGGWRVMVIVGGAAGALGAFASKLASWWGTR